MRLSVIILNYEVRYFLEQCIHSVLKAIKNIDAEVIVVDNHSSDNSCEMVLSQFPQVKLIAHPENAGFPKGNNIGVAVAQGDYILILNPDTVLPEDALEKALAHYEQLDNPGILGVKLLDGSGKFLPESKRGVPTPFVAFTKVVGLYKIFPKWFGQYYASHLNPNSSGSVAILVGAFMLMPRQMYLDAGGFDENCFMYSDDIDLSYTILKSGRTNYYYHEVMVIHYKGESTVKDRNYVKRFSEAMNFFYRKHFRKAVVFDLILKLAAYFFSKAKSAKSDPITQPEWYYLVSNNTFFQHVCAEKLDKEVVLVPHWQAVVIKSGTEILFDTNYLSFSEIIEAMEQLHNRGVTFKMAYQDAGFLIGSNSSNDRGTIIKLTDNR
jgi:GT2 family glycosyltransferase